MTIIFERAAGASRELPKVVPNKINRILNEIADQVEESAELIVAANALDRAAIAPSDSLYEQVMLDSGRIEAAAEQVRSIAALPSALGKIHSSTKRPNEMVVNKVAVPYGVVGVIYEHQPTIALISFSLCFKSGNALILNGETMLQNTTKAIVKIIKEVLEDNGINADAITLMEGDRQSTVQMLHAVSYIDLIILRGSNSLNEFARDNSRVPIITTLTGVCHTYIDAEACTDKATAIVLNAKSHHSDGSSSMGCLIVHRSQLENIAKICEPLAAHNVTIFADTESHDTLQGVYPHLEIATSEHYTTEFGGNKMAIITVSNIDDALAHISRYSAKHSEAIVTESCDAAKRFTTEVDAACVYHNVSMAFTDGTQLGMGTEIGISTQKLGARGPMSLSELTTYKYIIIGDSQIR